MDDAAKLKSEIAMFRAERDGLKYQIMHQDDCPSCKGTKVRWYSLIGMSSCMECKGTGKKR